MAQLTLAQAATLWGHSPCSATNMPLQYAVIRMHVARGQLMRNYYNAACALYGTGQVGQYVAAYVAIRKAQVQGVLY